MLSLLVVPGGPTAVRRLVSIYPLGFTVALFAGGPLFEEPGWRGFALPRLQQRFGSLLGTVILAVLWACWHLPLYVLVPGFNGAGTDLAGIAVPFAVFVISTVALAIIFTWVFNNTSGSVFLAILLHASIDAAVPTFTTNPLIYVMPTVVLGAIALPVVIATRGRLSYKTHLGGIGASSPSVGL
jgi:membrane protease YdiL (CAAX protease family)